MKRVELRNQYGEVIGIVTIHPSRVVNALPEVVTGPEACRQFIHAMHAMPDSVGTALVQIPRLNTVNKLNRGVDMDIFNSLAEKAAEQEPKDPIRLVAPSVSEDPKDGLMTYVAVEDISDLSKEHGPRTIFTFSEQAMPILKAFAEYSSLFKQTPTIVAGVPNATYSGEFDSVTWSLHRVAYHSLINDALEAARRDKDAAEEKKASSTYEKEKSTYTRKSGDVKAFTAFDVHPVPASAEDEASADVED